MKKLILWRFILLCCILLPCQSATSIAQDSLVIFDYPSEKEITVDIRAAVVRTGQLLLYDYKLSSRHTSLQRVWRFSVRHGSVVQDLLAPDGWDMRISPVPFPRVSWGASDSTNDIFPGESLPGFSFSSQGIPSIGDFYATGWVEPPSFDIEPDSIIGGVFPENSFQGKTLVPVNPLDPFVPLTFLDTLISYKHQARSLGWILNDGIVTSLDQKLEAARPAIINDRPSAKNILQAFVNEVEALNQQGNQLTSEAYALLKFNAEYLISKL
jgi:hypothetical protein